MNATAANAPDAATDFSDRLSPMLVKELRQGLRTRVFTSVFILLQVLLMFLTFVASSAAQTNEMIDGFFWFFLSLALLLIGPLRGINALSQEAKLNTLELILLTRLDAFRIVFGKWASIVSQTALFAIAVLPYVVLRYFLGGVNIVQDLITLALLLFLSGILTALTIGFSAFQAILLRVVFFVGAGIATLYLTTFIIGRMFFSSFFSPSASLTPQAYVFTVIGIILTGVFFIYYLLDMGAARIAPQSANHATRKRLLALSAVLILFSLPSFGVPEGFSITVALAVAIVACIDALTESPAVTTGVFQGTLYRRILPGFTRFFLAPGWHTGVLFTLLLMGIFGIFIGTYFYSSSDPEFYGVPIVFSSVVLFPVLITQLFFKNSTQLMSQYVVVQCIGLTVAAILGTAAEGADVEWVLWMGCFIPHVAFTIILNESSTIPPVAILCGAIIVITVLVGLLRSVPIFRQMNEGYRKARESWRRQRHERTGAIPSAGE